MYIFLNTNLVTFKEWQNLKNKSKIELNKTQIKWYIVQWYIFNVKVSLACLSIVYIYLCACAIFSLKIKNIK